MFKDNNLEKQLKKQSGSSETAISTFTNVIQGLKDSNIELENIHKQATEQSEYYREIACSVSNQIAKNNSIIEKTTNLIN